MLASGNFNLQHHRYLNPELPNSNRLSYCDTKDEVGTLLRRCSRTGGGTERDMFLGSPHNHRHLDASVSGMLRSLAGFQLTTADAPRLARFYRDALGFKPGPLTTTSPVDLTVFGVSGGARSVCLRLGGQQIELQMFDNPGRAYPRDSTAADLIFQHLAFVTSEAALA